MKEQVSVSLNGADAGRFEVTQPIKSTLDRAESQTTFTIRAVDGLPIGAYSATVTVSVENIVNMTFLVSQTITPPDIAVKQVVVNDGISPKAGSALKIILWALLGAVLIAGDVLLVRFAILKRKS